MNPAEYYIINQPEPYQTIIYHLQLIIERILPKVELKFKYKIPYYYLNNKPLCYINVSHKKQFVDLGFSKGFQLTVRQDELFGGKKRNTVKSLRYFKINDVDDDVLVDVIKEIKTLYL